MHTFANRWDRRALRTTSVGAIAIALFHGGAAFAQAASPALASEGSKDTAQQQIIVTGSRIERKGFEQPTPTTVVGAAEIRVAAKPTIQQVLNDQPQFRATTSPTISSGNTSTGTAPVDLRGLGSNRTLVLLNGRRFIGEGNLNFIPLNLVSRVEVVTGGASAAYGSGAVAGVVNIILKNRLNGLTVDGSAGVSSRGDGKRYSLDGAYGTSFADDRAHFMIGAEYVDDKGILDRNSRHQLGSAGIVRVNPTSATDLRTELVRDVNFGNMTRGGLITTGVLAGQTFNSDGTLRPFQGGTQLGAARFNAQMIGGADGVGLYDDVGASTPFKRINGYARLSYDLPQATVWVDAMYGRTTSDTPFLPDYVVGPITIQASNPFLSPTIAAQLAAANQTSFTFNKLFDDTFFLHFNVLRRNKEVAAGVDGTFGASWKYHAHVSHGQIYADQELSNSRIAANFTKAIAAVKNSAGSIVCAVNADANPLNDDPACVPLNPFGSGNASAAALAYVTGTQESVATNTLDAAGADISGDLVNLWAGPLTVAAGAEVRSEGQQSSRGALSRISPPIFGPLSVYTSDTSGGFNVKEAFAEAALPVLDVAGVAKIDLNGAARYSDYSTSGGIWSWKIGGTVRLFNDVLLRATRSRDIRSPSIGELYSVRAINIGPLVDQDSAGRTGTPGYSANPQTVTTFSGGNPNLRPETAKTFTAGASYSPHMIPGLSLSVDYYNINVAGYVATLSGSLLTLSCHQGNAASCASVVRDSTGTVTTVFTNNQNIASLQTKGWDLEAVYGLKLASIDDALPGTFHLRGFATHVDKFVFNNGLTTVDTAGDVGSSTLRAIPKWRGTLTANYDVGRLNVDARLRYIGGGKFDHLATTLINNEVNSRTYFDLGAEFRLNRRFSVFGNVNNVFDRDPPITPTGSPIYDIVGTYFTFGARVHL
jgi:outer membrane receptor protein involved in Fe transport